MLSGASRDARPLLGMVRQPRVFHVFSLARVAYLKTMCGDMGYEVLANISILPERLPYLCRRLTMQPPPTFERPQGCLSSVQFHP